MDGCLGDSIYKGGRIRLLSCIGTGKEHTAALYHYGSQLFDHKYRYGKIGVYDPCPLLKAVVFIFCVGTDAGIAYKPVNMVCLLFQLLHKNHHLFIGRHICLYQSHLRSFFLRKALLKRQCLLLIMSICYEDPVSFCRLCQDLFGDPSSDSGGTACDHSYFSHFTAPSVHQISVSVYKAADCGSARPDRSSGMRRFHAPA